ncbi:hypothetical protein D9M69_706130 [compost metagenome]
MRKAKSVAPIFGIDKPPVAITTLSAVTTPASVSSRNASPSLPMATILHGVRQATLPISHSAFSMAMICSADWSQNSCPLCFS